MKGENIATRLLVFGLYALRRSQPIRPSKQQRPHRE